MTTLEIILIIALWATYGTFTSHQQNDDYEDLIAVIIIAPIILIMRIVVGIFTPINK